MSSIQPRLVRTSSSVIGGGHTLELCYRPRAQSRSYTYDLDGNRLTKTIGGVTHTSTYDRTDQLIGVSSGGSPTLYGYDTYGNLTSNAESISSVTTMTYDLADKLTGIYPTGTADDVEHRYD